MGAPLPSIPRGGSGGPPRSVTFAGSPRVPCSNGGFRPRRALPVVGGHRSGVSRGGSCGSAWERVGGRRGQRRWSSAVTYLPPPAVRKELWGSGPGRAAGSPRLRWGHDGEVDETGNSALFRIDFRKKGLNNVALTEALGRGLCWVLVGC